MAEGNPITDQLRQLLKCTICKEEKDQLKLLDCQHAACVACLSPIVEKETDKISCPTCSQKTLVPNGGVAGFPDSLVAKQMAAILNETKLSEAPESSSEGAPSGEPEPSAECSAKLPAGEFGDVAAKPDYVVKELMENAGKRAKLRKELEAKAGLAYEWMKVYENNVRYLSAELKLLPNQCQMAKKELQDIRDTEVAKLQKEIDQLRSQSRIKINDIQKHRSDREQELKTWLQTNQPRLNKVQDAMKNIQTNLKELQKKNVRKVEISAAIRKLETLKPLKIQPDGEVTEEDFLVWHTGESVRREVSAENIDHRTIESKISYSVVGRIIQIRRNLSNETVIMAVFPADETAETKFEVLERGEAEFCHSLTKCTLPVMRERARIRDGAPSKHAETEWKKCREALSKDKIEGIVLEMKKQGTYNVMARVHFTNGDVHEVPLEDLEAVEGPTLKVGERVWLARNGKTPARGFCGVTRSSYGVVLSVDKTDQNDADVVVKFPECPNWQGKMSELVGNVTAYEDCFVQVSLKVSLTDATKWRGVTHEDYGKVVRVRDRSGVKHATVKFGRKDIDCPLSELECAWDQNSAEEFMEENAEEVVDLSGLMLHHFQQQMRQRMLLGDVMPFPFM